MSQIFLSYASEDIKITENLRGDLEAAGFTVWRDKEKLKGGDRWTKRIAEAIKASSHVVVVWSPNAAQSDFVAGECLKAQEINAEIIPLIIEQEPLPVYVLNRQYIDSTEIGYAAGLQRLLSDLGKSVEEIRPIVEKQQLHEKRKKLFIGSAIGIIGIVIISFVYYLSIWVPRQYIISLTHTVDVVYDNFSTIEAQLTKDAQALLTHSSETSEALATTTTETPRSTSTASQTPTFTPANSLTIEPTLGIGSTKVSPTDRSTSVYVPAGEFLMGSNDADIDYIMAMCPSCVRGAIEDQKPKRQVFQDAYWIDLTEVTNAQFARFVEEAGYVTEAEREGISYVYVKGVGYSKISNANWRNPSGQNSIYEDQKPVVHVSWNDAAAFCSWMGRRLPTEAEWEKAARGLDGNIFPWGNKTPDSGLLNFNFAVGTSTDVMSYLNGASVFGVLDMSGNVWEWVYDFYGENYYYSAPNSNPAGPYSGEGHVQRGGSWASSQKEEMINVTTTFRLWNFSDAHNDLVGFRCAMDAEE